FALRRPCLHVIRLRARERCVTQGCTRTAGTRSAPLPREQRTTRSSRGTRKRRGLQELLVRRQVEEAVARQADQDDGASSRLAGELRGLDARGGDGVVRLRRGDGALAAGEAHAGGERVLL